MARFSALRLAEDKAFTALSLTGSILDIGGSRRANYPKLIGGSHTFTFANISGAYDPDLIFDAEEIWPVEEGSYDAVVMNNVLEHLYRPHNALVGAYRAIKSGGMFVAATPFLYRVHGAPDDYFRYTRSALNAMLRDKGFVNIDIQVLGTGPFSVAYDAVLYPLKPDGLMAFGQKAAAAADRLLARLRSNGQLSAENFPLGYFMTARKPG